MEKNRATLTSALRKLPEYDPPTSLWDDLESALDADDLLKQSIPNLPVYDPPETVWSDIEAKLNQPVQQTLKIRSRNFRRYAVAATLAGALLAAWFLLRPATIPTDNLTVSQEKIDNTVAAAAREPEDDAFKMVQNLCAGAAPVCNQPQFKALKSELDELTKAKQELRDALGPYGDDSELTAQLVRIERERSELLQQMIQMI
jgi:HAMP domain-containing protein